MIISTDAIVPILMLVHAYVAVAKRKRNYGKIMRAAISLLPNQKPGSPFRRAEFMLSRMNYLHPLTRPDDYVADCNQVIPSLSHSQSIALSLFVLLRAMRCGAVMRVSIYPQNDRTRRGPSVPEGTPNESQTQQANSINQLNHSSSLPFLPSPSPPPIPSPPS